VRVVGFGARPDRGRVVVSWRTAAETDVLGFNVWRGTTKVNRSLIHARGALRGSSYRFVDRGVRAGARYTYRLQLVTRSGAKSWYGSVRVRAQR
jgi:hypothetical protein